MLARAVRNREREPGKVPFIFLQHRALSQLESFLLWNYSFSKSTGFNRALEKESVPLALPVELLPFSGTT
jgi:hypothetical protein